MLIIYLGTCLRHWTHLAHASWSTRARISMGSCNARSDEWGEPGHLVTYEPVEFEKSPVGVQHFRMTIDSPRGTYGTYQCCNGITLMVYRTSNGMKRSEIWLDGYGNGIASQRCGLVWHGQGTDIDSFKTIYTYGIGIRILSTQYWGIVYLTQGTDVVNISINYLNPETIHLIMPLASSSQ